MPTSSGHRREASIESIQNRLVESIVRVFHPDNLSEVISDLSALVQEVAKLRILIWGPGEEGRLFDKRCELRTMIKDLGHIAYFSEELLSEEELRCGGLNLQTHELIQAYCVDYIICLLDSPGSIGEFCTYGHRFASKMLLCVDVCNSRGYLAEGPINVFEGGNGKVDWFVSPDDLVDCNLAKRVLLHVEKVAARKNYEMTCGEEN